MRHLLPGMLAATVLFATACGGNSVSTFSSDEVARPWPPGSGMAALQLPTDGVQPWESLDGAGQVIPGSAGRSASAGLGPNSEFQSGSQRFLEGGGFSDLGAATKLDSPAGGPLAYAMYRFPLGAEQPGVVTVDANLHGAAQYYVALSDFQAGRWRWHGPFTEAQITLLVAAGDATSPLGNTFVIVAAYDGAEIDVVGVGVTPRSTADTVPPPVPAAPLATAIAGGVELTWVPVIAGDLAGYRVHYSNFNFTAPFDPGVKSLPWLEGTTRLILPADPARVTYVALSAVDVSGNASALSPRAFALAHAGEAATIELTTSLISGKLNDAATLTVSGGSSYDFDLDGDGIFEVTGNTSGTAQVDTSQTGLIRPRVRGTGAGGAGVALGSVSLIINGNQSPVAFITTSSRTKGADPLPVSLQGSASTDFDGTIEEWAWDASGDGIFEQTSATVSDFSGMWSGAPDLFAVRLRVTDDDGAWDVDTISIEVQVGKLDLTYEPSLDVGERTEIRASYAGWEAVTEVQWDLESNGSVDATGPLDAPQVFWALIPGDFTITATATLETGATASAIATYFARGWWIDMHVGPVVGVHYPSGATIGNRPAVTYIDAAGQLMFTIGDDKGMNWAPSIAVSPADDCLKCSMVRLAGGSVGLAFTDQTDGDLLYTSPTAADGSTWTTPVVLESNGVTPDHISIAVINGNPAVAYYHSGLTDPLFVRASDALGSSWNGPVVIEDLPANDGQRICLAEINGRPAVAFAAGGFDLRYARAADSAGNTWSPSILVALLSDVDTQPLALASIGGNPAVAYTYNSSESGVYYRRANDSDGISWGQLSIIAESNLYQYFAPKLAVAAGKPCLTYSNGSDQFLAQANTVDGFGWNSEVVFTALLTDADATSALFEWFQRPVVAQGEPQANQLAVGINW